MILDIINRYSILQLLCMGVLTVTFAYQMWFYLFSVARVASHRHGKRNRKTGKNPPVSVVVVIRDDFYFIENNLPPLLEQEYDNYEVVVVDDCSDEAAEIASSLKMMRLKYPHLKYTAIPFDDYFKHNNKLALNIGIKSATHDNIIITRPDCRPASAKWVGLMARGFTGTNSIVTGYTAVEPAKGLKNKLIRCDNLFISARFLKKAVKGKCYKASERNYGFTKDTYFNSRGFNNPRLSVGDNDAFLQPSVTRNNVSVILSPTSTMVMESGSGRRWWFEYKKFFTYTYRYYPGAVKWGMAWEMLSRCLFLASAASMFALMSERMFWIAAGALVLLRLAAVMHTVDKVAKRVGERGLVWAYILYDLYSPVTETYLSAVRKLRPSKGLWV